MKARSVLVAGGVLAVSVCLAVVCAGGPLVAHALASAQGDAAPATQGVSADAAEKTDDPTEQTADDGTLGGALDDGITHDPGWGEGLDCASCHSKEADAEKPTLANAHAESVNAACTLCHDDAALEAVHQEADADSKMPKRLKKSKVTDTVCLTCHDRDVLAETTAQSTVCTDERGTVVNPHQLPVNDDHAQTQCVSCHKSHKTDEVQVLAQEYCIGCHHENIYECGTCHE